MSRRADPLFLIVDPDRAHVTTTCAGPDDQGQCPDAIPGEPVPCAGRQLVLLHSDLGPRWTRAVGDSEDGCPVPVMCAGGS